MPHSYVSNLVHYIFSTKERFPFIDQELEERLWPYLLSDSAVRFTDSSNLLRAFPAINRWAIFTPSASRTIISGSVGHLTQSYLADLVVLHL